MPPQPVSRQPSLRRPLGEITDDQLGRIGLFAEVNLWVQNERGRVPTQKFLVDSGASITSVSLELAVKRRLPVPPVAAEVWRPIHTADGIVQAPVRIGHIRVWWTADTTTDGFEWPVMFRGDLGLDIQPVLGLLGVVADCRWTFDGSPAPGFPFGSLTLEDIR